MVYVFLMRYASGHGMVTVLNEEVLECFPLKRIVKHEEPFCIVCTRKESHAFAA